MDLLASVGQSCPKIFVAAKEPLSETGHIPQDAGKKCCDFRQGVITGKRWIRFSYQ